LLASQRVQFLRLQVVIHEVDLLIIVHMEEQRVLLITFQIGVLGYQLLFVIHLLCWQQFLHDYEPNRKKRNWSNELVNHQYQLYIRAAFIFKSKWLDVANHWWNGKQNGRYAKIKFISLLYEIPQFSFQLAVLKQK
jgi:hypothetical protein